MTKLHTRHVQEGDVDAVHQIMVSAHVTQGTMRLPVHAREMVLDRIRYEKDVVKLVAEVDGAVAGYAELICHSDPRNRHSGELNMIATHPDFRGRKVGTTMMDAIIDLADNWLQLSRLGLIVWTRNLRAIELYEAYGFAVEGTMRRYVFLEGKHCDAHVMGRILERSAAAD